LNPYFIFRVLSFVLGAFLGMDIFNVKNTFTDISDDESNNENKKSKNTKIETINKDDQKDIETKPESTKDAKSESIKDTKSESTKDAKSESKDGDVKPTGYMKKRQMDLFEIMMRHQEQTLELNRKEAEEGTSNLVENLEEQIVQDRAQDMKAIYNITKSLHDMNVTDESTSNPENKRSISEQDNENKKSKSDENKNKRSRQD
jgi:uncharacterized protein (DUF305 family)